MTRWAFVGSVVLVACSSSSARDVREVPADSGSGGASGSASGGTSGTAGTGSAGKAGSSGSGGSSGAGATGGTAGDAGCDGSDCGACSGCAPGESCFEGVCGGNSVVKVSAGSGACALLKSGAVYCWGTNQYGQTGAPLSGNQSCGPNQWPCRPQAVRVAGLDDATDIAVGLDFVCAVRKTGKVVCWGRNDLGQLGHDPVGDDACGEPCALSPVEVAGLSSAKGVAAGRWNACSWSTTGALHCWGRNDEGVVGKGSFGGPELAPVPVVGLSSGVTDVALVLGGIINHACARRDDGTVHCWGGNEYFQLGHAHAGDATCLGQHCNATPAQVPGLTDVVDVFAVDATTCAVKQDETLHCWGFDGNGSRGGLVGTSPTPQAVAGLPEMASGSGFRLHMCARSKLSDVYCWGPNVLGQLGDGTTQGGYNGHACNCKPPTQVPGLKVRMVAAGDEFNVAIKLDGAVVAWGRNAAGELGHLPETDGDVTSVTGFTCNPEVRTVLGLP